MTDDVRQAGEDDLALLRTIDTAAEAAIVRNLLDDAQIPYLLRKPRPDNPLDFVRALVPDTGFLIGPVEIWVHRERRDEADALLTGGE